MPTQTLASTWSPISCPASTDLWEIYLTTSAVFFNLGPLTATSDCAPSGYTPTIPYYAVSCPTGYTSACAHGLDDATTVCCPTHRPMTCASSAKVYSSLTLSCEERFSSSYTAEVTQTSVFGDSHKPETATVTFTPHFDAINGFGLEYVSMRSTSSNSVSTRAATTASATPSSSNNSGNSLSGGTIAGIVVAVVTFIVIVALVWNRTKINAWIHQKTAPRLIQTEQGMYPNNTSQPSLRRYPNGNLNFSSVMVQPMELESTREPVELPATRTIAEKSV